MDKPISLSVKNFLIRRMSVDMAIPEKVIEAVVNHQFNAMLDAMSTCNSVELSGFGKFLFNSKKAAREMQKQLVYKQACENLLSQELTEQKRKSVQAKLDTVEANIAALKPKLHED